MNYKIFIIFFFVFVISCANQNFNKKKILDPVIVQKYSNSGFTLVYKDELFKNKIGKYNSKNN